MSKDDTKPRIKAAGDQKSFWTTLPGILTGCIGVITAVTGCITAVIGLYNILKPVPTPSPLPPFATSTVTVTVAPATVPTATATNTPLPPSPTIEPPKLPDLTITKVELNPVSPVRSNQTQANVTILNQGEGPASNFDVQILPSANDAPTAVRVPILNAGQSITETINITYSGFGVFESTASAVATAGETETRYDNNQFIFSVTVQPNLDDFLTEWYNHDPNHGGADLYGLNDFHKINDNEASFNVLIFLGSGFRILGTVRAQMENGQLISRDTLPINSVQRIEEVAVTLLSKSAVSVQIKKCLYSQLSPPSCDPLTFQLEIK